MGKKRNKKGKAIAKAHSKRKAVPQTPEEQIFGLLDDLTVEVENAMHTVAEVSLTVMTEYNRLLAQQLAATR